MKRVTLNEVFNHPITQKYLQRSGIHHAVSTAEQAVTLAEKQGVDLDLAAKSALLHDIGHYEWYKDGKWDYDEYRKHDIHAIKGAERSHKLLIRLGENKEKAKTISIAILLHTDSYLPFSVEAMRTPLHDVVFRADEMEELPGGAHHYVEMDTTEANERLAHLEERILQSQDPQRSIS